MAALVLEHDDTATKMINELDALRAENTLLMAKTGCIDQVEGANALAKEGGSEGIINRLFVKKIAHSFLFPKS